LIEEKKNIVEKQETLSPDHVSENSETVIKQAPKKRKKVTEKVDEKIEEKPENKLE